MKVLVTGGTGYIGSHTVVELLENNHEITIVDNLSNSDIIVLDNIKKITNKEVSFYEIDCKDYDLLKGVFEKEKPEAVIHFAGYKAVGESVKEPLKYYENNINSTLNLLRLIKEYNCKNFVFSSSATVYSVNNQMPLNEEANLGVTNPYGQTKLMIECILKDFAKAEKDFNIAVLRYFNPLGAHKSGLIGENPKGIPNNLMPYILNVANEVLESLTIYGDDYPTKDGTGIRDYIHVVDLAKGHLLALNKLQTNPGLVVYNLGTGIGYSVFDVLNEMNKVVGFNIPYIVGKRRDGDVAICYADPTKAKKELGFEAKYNLHDMCVDSWKYKSKRNIHNEE